MYLRGLGCVHDVHGVGASRLGADVLGLRGGVASRHAVVEVGSDNPDVVWVTGACPEADGCGREKDKTRKGSGVEIAN